MVHDRTNLSTAEQYKTLRVSSSLFRSVQPDVGKASTIMAVEANGARLSHSKVSSQCKKPLHMDWFLFHIQGNRAHCNVDDSAIWHGSHGGRLFGRALGLRGPCEGTIQSSSARCRWHVQTQLSEYLQCRSAGVDGMTRRIHLQYASLELAS